MFFPKVSFDDASLRMEQLGLTYIETSALTGYNVKVTFRKIAKDLYVKELEWMRESGMLDLIQKKKEKAIMLTKKNSKKSRNGCSC